MAQGSGSTIGDGDSKHTSNSDGTTNDVDYGFEFLPTDDNGSTADYYGTADRARFRSVDGASNVPASSPVSVGKLQFRNARDSDASDRATGTSIIARGTRILPVCTLHQC